MENKPQPSFNIGQFFLQKEKRKLFKIVDRNWVGIVEKGTRSKVKEGEYEVNDWLYDIEYANKNETKRYGRYYEGRIVEECTLIEDQVLPKAIYD